MNRREFLRNAALSLPLLSLGLPAQTARKRPNVLFIGVDDLRPELKCYGRSQMITPNLDELAATGMLFERTYCQQAVCGPSRTSLLTGLRPDSTQVYDLQTHFRDKVPDVVTLPEHFRNNGYFATGIGKMYHGGLGDKRSWSEPYLKCGGRGYVEEDNTNWVRKVVRERKAKGHRRPGYAAYSFPFEDADVPDTTYRDGALAEAAEKHLERLAAMDKPFFFGVGFYKPHLPFNCPKRFWDLYKREDIDLADNPFVPKGCPPLALHNSSELRSYRGVPKGNEAISDDLARELIHGYQACTSFTDHNIGRLLKKLKALGLEKDTIVIVWGDHGWQLGDHGLWCKHTNFEVAAHVPMILRVPGAATAGRTCRALTEFVDIYPGLCELAGIPLAPHLEGSSFAPLVEAPDRSWKLAAFSQYPRGGTRIMGYSMRTDRYRYTEWIVRGGEVEARELYDHEKDPKENVNLAVQEDHADMVRKLGAMLHEGWRASRPPA